MSTDADRQPAPEGQVAIAGPPIGVVGLSVIGFILLACASWGFILWGGDSGFEKLFSGEDLEGCGWIHREACRERDGGEGCLPAA